MPAVGCHCCLLGSRVVSVCLGDFGWGKWEREVGKRGIEKIYQSLCDAGVSRRCRCGRECGLKILRADK